MRTLLRLAIDIAVALITFALLASVSGCAITPRVVTTEIRKTDNGFEIISPKDTKVQFVGNPSGYFWFSYDAHASADALTAGAAESATRAAAVARLAEAAASLK